MLGSPLTNAQDGQIVPTEDPVYAQIERLQRRGLLLSLDPATLPYRSDQIADAVERESSRMSGSNNWALSYIRNRVTTRDNPIKRRGVKRKHGESRSAQQPILSAELGGAIRIVNTKRLDVLRPLENKVRPYQLGTFGFGIVAGHWVARIGVRHDGYYDRDPDALDSVNRLAIRSQDAYVGYRSRYADITAGRLANHWAPRSDAALFVSDNPHPYDALRIRIGTERYYLESIVGELDSSTDDGRFTGRVGDGRDATSRRRFLSAHKFVWRPSHSFMMAIQEAVVYSGRSSGLSLKYINPVTALVFEVDNTPKNDENNGMIGGLIWFQVASTTFSGQLFFDDLDLRREGARIEPPAFSLAGSIVHARRNSSVDFGSRLEVVTARNYSAPQPEGRYIYLLRGLATQFSDYVLSETFASIYLDEWVGGLTVRPSLTVLLQGELDMRLPYPTNEVGALLTGTVERTVMPSLDVTFAPDPHGWLKARFGYTSVSNSDHVEGVDSGQFVFSISTGVRFSVNNRK